MKRKWLITAVVATVGLAVGGFYWLSAADEASEIEYTVKKGDFRVAVTVTGELDAQNKTNIMGPSTMQAIQIWQAKISSIIPEGTVVKEGDFVAELDRSELSDKLKNAQNELTKAESQLTQARLDTALTLREARERLINMQFAVEEKELVLEQSTYEPPATIKRAQIDLEKAKRDLGQAKENYNIKVSQAKAKMQEAQATFDIQQGKVNMYMSAFNQFTILAPKSGMVVYAREWNGQKIRQGSSINAWDPTVATLPDLSNMISKTYINEVDIRKIQSGQGVKVSLDAFPDKKLTGKVIEVANVGEQKPNSDAKVFEVVILIDQKDTTLRPAMTTGNSIEVATVPKVLFVPLECVHHQDNISYVYKKDGVTITKQEVKIGLSNENEVIITEGLKDGEVVLLSAPQQFNGDITRLPGSKDAPAKNAKPQGT